MKYTKKLASMLVLFQQAAFGQFVDFSDNELIRKAPEVIADTDADQDGPNILKREEFNIPDWMGVASFIACIVFLVIFVTLCFFLTHKQFAQQREEGLVEGSYCQFLLASIFPCQCCKGDALNNNRIAQIPTEDQDAPPSPKTNRNFNYKNMNGRRGS